MPALLEVAGLTVSYGAQRALVSVNLELQAGELVALLGMNGAGKTTLLRTISGLLVPQEGEIRWVGRPIHGWPPHRIVSLGIVQVPEGRHLFPRMTVKENLELGAYLRGGGNLEEILAVFPLLKTKLQQLVGTLSGGEQQMVAIGRALMARPVLLLLDEPTLGLSPKLSGEILETIRELKASQGLSVVLVTQEEQQALEMADKAYYMEGGRLQPADHLLLNRGKGAVVSYEVDD